MISAEEARKLMPRTLDAKLEDLGRRIEELASEGKNKLVCGSEDYNLDLSLWISGGYNRTDEYIRATKKLRDLGYEVTFYYDEAGQLVDMYTLIEW